MELSRDRGPAELATALRSEPPAGLLEKLPPEAIVGVVEEVDHEAMYLDVHGALSRVEERSGRPALEVLEQAIKSVTPSLEVRSRRVGGATYQVPVEVRVERRQALAIRWLIAAARGRNERTMVEKLSGELLDAANNRGNAVKKREDTHRMADANRAFSHYRW